MKVNEPPKAKKPATPLEEETQEKTPDKVTTPRTVKYHIEKKPIKNPKDKRYLYRYYPVVTIDGKRHYHGSYLRDRDAEAFLNQCRQQVRDGTYGKAAPTVDDVYKVWIETLKTQERAAGTIGLYERQYRLYLQPRLGDLKLDNDFAPATIQHCINDIIAANQRLSPATVNQIYRTIRACLNFAQAQGTIPVSPCRNIRVPSPRRRDLDFLSNDEFQQLCDVAEEPFRTLIIVLGTTGIRVGEALGLEWRHVNLQSNTLRIEQAANWRTGLIGDTKTVGSDRTLDMLPVTATVLREHYEREGTPHQRYFVFTVTNGDSTIDQNNFRKRFNKYLNQAGLRHVKIHSLRHVFASTCLDNNVPFSLVQHYLGHKSSLTTVGVYYRRTQTGFGDKKDTINNLFTVETPTKPKVHKSPRSPKKNRPRRK